MEQEGEKGYIRKEENVYITKEGNVMEQEPAIIHNYVWNKNVLGREWNKEEYVIHNKKGGRSSLELLLNPVP